jgi:tetratricopeptide (TPR) repeat protein
MNPFRASRAQVCAAGSVAAVLGGVGFVPLFGGPGYESALASGLCVPTAAAVATALDVSESPAASPLECVGRGLQSGLVLAFVAVATTLLHGVRIGICDLAGGLLLFALTAGIGALMGGAFGVLVGEFARGSRRRRLLCVLGAPVGPVAGIVVSVARFYGSPMVFAFDPFFGFFSGALYDTVVDVRPELWTYRAGSLATLTGVALVASALERNARGSIALPSMGGSSQSLWRLGLGSAALAASLGVAAAGPVLGHWQTATTIAAALGGRAAGPRCDVVFPDTLSLQRAALIERDCEEEVAAVEERLHARLDGRLVAFFFRDTAEKHRLMGAADTSIAKPWRHEVYLQLAGYPHPVLGHEIAHVVAGSFACGPFRVGGRALGWWPNPGLIEGVAVSASPDDDELSGAQWARAMLDLGILPRMRDVFSLGFLGDNAAKSYTVAGAFVTWVTDRWGPEVMHAWYAGASLEDLTRSSWTAIESQFHVALSALDMPAGASAYARARFGRPGLWTRHCPHVVDAFDRQGDSCRNDRRFDRAKDAYQQALERDASDWHARFETAKMDLFLADPARGRAQLERLAADEAVPRTVRDRADEALGDDDLTRGRNEEAAERYRGLADRVLDEDFGRTMEVKALGAADPRARSTVLSMLVGDPSRGIDPWLGALRLGDWAASSQDALALYLVGRNLALREEFAEASAWLDRAILAGGPTPRIARESIRLRAVCACVLRDDRGLERVSELLVAPDSPFASATGRRDWVARLIARCR